MLEMYELKKATVVVIEVTSMERRACWRVLDTRVSSLVLVSVVVCCCQTRERMKVSSAPTPRAMMTARMFMKGKNESLKTKV